MGRANINMKIQQDIRKEVFNNDFGAEQKFQNDNIKGLKLFCEILDLQQKAIIKTFTDEQF